MLDSRITCCARAKLITRAVEGLVDGRWDPHPFRSCDPLRPCSGQASTKLRANGPNPTGWIPALGGRNDGGGGGGVWKSAP